MSQLSLLLLRTPVIELHMGDLSTNGLPAIHGLLPLATEAISPLGIGPPTVGPSHSCGPQHRTDKAPGQRSNDPRRSRDRRSAPIPPLSPHMSTPRSISKRGPLKRLFVDKSNDASTSTTTSCMRSIVSLLTFKKRNETRPPQHSSLSLSTHSRGINLKSVQNAPAGAI